MSFPFAILFFSLLFRLTILLLYSFALLNVVVILIVLFIPIIFSSMSTPSSSLFLLFLVFQFSIILSRSIVVLSPPSSLFSLCFCPPFCVRACVPVELCMSMRACLRVCVCACVRVCVLQYMCVDVNIYVNIRLVLCMITCIRELAYVCLFSPSFPATSPNTFYSLCFPAEFGKRLLRTQFRNLKF